METLLNLAHRSHRKGEHYIASHQFTEAIFHFHKASEYFEKSIQITTCDIVRSSLLVQHHYCLSQIEFLKRRILNKIRKEINSKSNNSSSCDHQRNKRNIAELVITNSSIMTFDMYSKVEYNQIYKIIGEQESLLNCLMKNPGLKETIPTNQSTNNDEYNDEDNKNVIEKMKILNERMKNLFNNLVENLEKSQQEIQTLKKENQTLRKEIATLKSQSLANKVPFPELPPLEPPTLLY